MINHKLVIADKHSNIIKQYNTLVFAKILRMRSSKLTLIANTFMGSFKLKLIIF